MKILVTGASGFLGSHTVKALLDGGHDVRVLIRSAERLEQALAPLGCGQRVDVAAGDITDRVQVRAALAGCDGVVHGAAIYSFDPRRDGEVLATNVSGAENVLGEAGESGLDPIVHVSSYVALLPSAAPLTPESPVGSPKGAYAVSKARSDQVARRFQEQGAPVTITYPGFVLGPHDPWLGESTVLMRDAMAGRIPLSPPGGVPLADVRDVAAILVAALKSGQGPRRYLAAGDTIPLADMLRPAVAMAGRRLRGAPPPKWMLLGIARAAEAGRRHMRLPLPLGYPGPWVAAQEATVDASATFAELGVRLRPAAETIEDTARWLIDSGKVRPR